ncbi:MAG: AgmX/PglI C-terminal domain-containing protein [Myxococcota bacterium]
MFKHFPLSFHKQALPAARAAECAREQGSFWEMAERLFSNQDRLGTDFYVQSARALGLEVGRFAECFASERHRSRIEGQMEEGREAGVRGTPTFYLNGRKFTSPSGYNLDAFKRVIEEYYDLAGRQDGAEVVVGRGSGGLGFHGRIVGMGKLDTGGGMGAKAGLAKAKKDRRGTLRVGTGLTNGCAPKDVSRVVLRRIGAIRACYQARLESEPELAGTLELGWTIGQRGKVRAVEVPRDTLEDSKAKNCVVRVLRRMRFPKPDGGTCRVLWPFVFSPEP